MLSMLAEAPASLSSVTSPAAARDVHLLDSLSGLEVTEVRESGSLVDIGAGAGFPGIPLAAGLPDARVDLLDSVRRKVDFMNGVIETLGLGNARAHHTRSEEWCAVGTRGRETYDVATARAVAPLTALAELASPLLRIGGALVAWKGERERPEEDALARLESRLAMAPDRIVEVTPFARSRPRHLYVLRKTGPTPGDLPRRPGMVRKRPLTG
jgi:16S rRNA (guanine527-N7)-methyltransferase